MFVSGPFNDLSCIDIGSSSQCVAILPNPYTGTTCQDATGTGRVRISQIERNNNRMSFFDRGSNTTNSSNSSRVVVVPLPSSPLRMISMCISIPLTATGILLVCVCCCCCRRRILRCCKGDKGVAAGDRVVVMEKAFDRDSVEGGRERRVRALSLPNIFPSLDGVCVPVPAEFNRRASSPAVIYDSSNNTNSSSSYNTNSSSTPPLDYCYTTSNNDFNNPGCSIDNNNGLVPVHDEELLREVAVWLARGTGTGISNRNPDYSSNINTNCNDNKCIMTANSR